MLKRILVIFGSIIVLLLLVAFFSTSFVERETYYNEDYYKKAMAYVDSLKPLTDSGSLQAGFSKVNLTPTLASKEDNVTEGKFVEVPLSGYGGREGRPAQSIHDSIFVKAAAIKVGAQTAIFVGADLLIMPPNVIDSVTILLNAKGIHREQVFYSATHTHSSLGAWGPGKLGEEFSGKENSHVEQWLTQQIVAAVVNAVADLKPAKISTGNYAIEKYTRNRLIGKTGNKNNDFSFIVLEQIGDKKAIIGSYSAHATTLGENMEISADYPGYWQRKMEAGSFNYAIFFAGSVGSTSHAGGEGEHFDKPKFIGEALADSLQAPLSKLVMKDSIDIAAITTKIPMPEFHMRLTPEVNLSTMWSEQLLPFQGDVYLQAIRLGNMVWITTPCDFSSEFAMQLKNSLAVQGFNANVSSFNGGYVGYIVPGKYFYLDEYEPKSMGWFGPNMGEYTMDLIRQITRKVTGRDNI